MLTSEATNEIASAMSAAQGAMKPAIKDATNPHFKSKYADLASLFEAVREPFAKNGLTIWQELGNDEKGVTVKTRIAHKSGQWVEFGPLSVPTSKQDAQGVGSAATYARRYGLAAAVGIVADEDDDANAAVGRPAQKPADAPPKNAPGVTEARTWVTQHLRHLHGSTDGTDFMLRIIECLDRWTRIRAVYPNVWEGPENSGLHGEARKIAINYQCLKEYDDFIKSLDNATKQAAE